MNEFTPVTTQEQLDQIISERLKRERESTSKKYADYDALKSANADYEKQIASLGKSLDEATKQISSFEQERAELTSKISAYETSSVKMRIAREMNIPYELADRLSGDTEDAIREDAKALSQFVTAKKSAPPLRDTEPADSKNAVYTQLLNGLKGE